MQYELLYTFITQKLETGLPPYITYHDLEHTLNVISACEHIAKSENINGEDLTLLKTAALFHDSGFLQNHLDHEVLSCKLAFKYLPDYSYSAEQIEKICQMILTTRLPQTAVEPLSRVLCDADLFYLGGNDYEHYSDKLFQEFKKIGTLSTPAEWNQKQIEFLTTHQYFTQTAKLERDDKKKAMLNKIMSSNELLKTNSRAKDPLENLRDAILIICGVVIAGFALKCFLVPNKFFDGGITGISLLIFELYHINLAVVIVLLNLPFIIISYFSVGARFAIKTLISVILLGVSLWLLPEFPLTSDKLLISIFGGVFLGIGIGLIIRAGAALDGIEVLALYTLRRTSYTITEIILGINILIFIIAAFKFGVETALYSILTYFAATRTIDYVVEGIEAFTGVTIISGKSEVIKYQLVNKLGRGITVYKGERGFLPGKFESSTECDIIFTVITRLELRKLKNLVYEVDPNAFVFASTVKDTAGGIMKKKLRH